MDGDWPAVAEGPRCERCGQAHVPLPETGRFGCGHCGWPLVPREVQKARQARARRITGALLAATVVTIGTLLVRSAPEGRARSTDGPVYPRPEGTPEGPIPEGPPGAIPTPPGSPPGPMTGPHRRMQSGSPHAPPGYVPPGPSESMGYPQGSPPPRPGEAMMHPGTSYGPPGMMEHPQPASPVLAELERSISDLERTPPEERDTHRWNMAAGDHYWLHARELALADPSAPHRQGGERAAQRLREDRFAAGHPQSQDHLQRAQLAYERALDLAATPEQRGRAHQRLGDLLCARGEFTAGLKHAEQARKLVGDDARFASDAKRTAFLRARCLLGLRGPRGERTGSRR